MKDQIRQRMIFDKAYECAQKSFILVSHSRASVYGTVSDNFSRIVRALNIAWKGQMNFTVLDVASINIAIKLSRLLQTRTHEDSWVDMCGYACCGYVSSSRFSEEESKADFYEYILNNMKYDVSQNDVLMDFLESPDDKFGVIYQTLCDLNKSARKGNLNSWIKIATTACFCCGVFCFENS